MCRAWPAQAVKIDCNAAKGHDHVHYSLPRVCVFVFAYVFVSSVKLPKRTTFRS